LFRPTGFHNLPGIIAAVFPSVSDAPIRLQGKAIDHVFESPHEILSSVKNYYVNETLKQVYKIIGSLDFVGNPTILFSSFVSGVRDLVVAPTKAFLKSPTDVRKVGMGLGKGTLSFFSNGASGIFGFSARLWATAGQTVAVLSLDSEYRQWHRDRIVNEATNLNRVWKRRGVQSVQEIVFRPFADVALGVTMGATGFFTAPYNGAKKRGTRGLAEGVAVGTIGVVAKPVIGVFDAFTHVSQTVHDLAKSVNILERRYQPALKLRLPYVFGPMNILCPFDAVSARSVYLLSIFPPRTKLKRRIHMGKEIHVHSEVLKMEPRVETYAIATTIRVVLIKVPRDKNNASGPSFGWEVDLTSPARVSSAVSDHGHNGVALTITKRAPPRKSSAKGRQRSSLIREQPNSTMRSNTSSAVNASSLLSIASSEMSECEEEIFEPDESYENLQGSRSWLAEESKKQEPLTNVDSGDGTYDHEESKEHGAVLEWYTVLAEYQFRKQLTRLSNAVSCIVGDYDAIITDRLVGGDSASKTEDSVTFGIFNFEKGLPDGRSAKVANIELVSDLESLPWMTQTLFERVKVVPSSSRKDFLTRIRRTWGYSKDLEASVALGGPPWLIEARARAMHISRGNQPGYNCVTHDNVIQEIIEAEIDEGTVTSDIALDMVKRIRDDGGSSTIDTSKREMSNERTWMETTMSGIESSVPDQDHSGASDKILLDETGDDEIMSALLTTIKRSGEFGVEDKGDVDVVKSQRSQQPLRDQRRSIHRDSDGDIFFSMRNLGSSFELHDDVDETYEGDADDNDHDYRQEKNFGELIVDQSFLSSHLDHATTMTDTTEEPQDAFKKKILPVTAHEQKMQHDPVAQHNKEAIKGESTHAELHGRSDGISLTARKKKTVYQKPVASARSVQSLDMSETSEATSRMDRLEAVMEQLVLLNAAQLQQQQTHQMDTSNHSESSSAVHELADTLKQELADIRSQINVRAKEDEALRNEIRLLRDQLDERRSIEKKNIINQSRNSQVSNDAAAYNERRNSGSNKVRKFPVPEIRLKTMLPRRLATSYDRATSSGTSTVQAGGNHGDNGDAEDLKKVASSQMKTKKDSSEIKIFSGKASASESRSVEWKDSI
jgi:regulator of replication initiation timing